MRQVSFARSNVVSSANQNKLDTKVTNMLIPNLDD